MQVSRSMIVLLCARFGAALKVPSGISGIQLFWALSGNESSFGADCAPRHEAAYCRGGKYFDIESTSRWGCLAHCSYGPWQVMYPNVSRSGVIDPIGLMRQPELLANAAVQFINENILAREKATTVEQIADAYNSGDWRDQRVPAKYIADLVSNYEVPMPTISKA